MARKQMDIVLDSDGSFKTAGGDFMVDECTRQNMQQCIVSEKGEWKESPGSGVGVLSYLEDDLRQGVLSEINNQLSKDGMTLQSVQLAANGQIQVNGEYRQ